MFSTDSGIIVFISKNVFIDFIKKFDYNELVDSDTDLLNEVYWETLIDIYEHMM